MPTWAGTTSPGTAAALGTPRQGSRGRMLELPSFWLADVTPWGWWQQLPWGSWALAAVESPVKRRVTCTAGRRNSRWQGLHAELRTTKSCAAKEGNLYSHRSTGWRLPQEGCLRTSGSLAILCRLHEPVMVLLHFQRVKKATQSLYRFCNHCCILRYAPIILIWNTFSFTTSLLDFTAFSSYLFPVQCLLNKNIITKAQTELTHSIVHGAATMTGS